MKLLIFAAISFFTFTSIYAEDVHHHDDKGISKATEKAHSDASLVLDHGKKWEVDKNMKDNMAAIHGQFEKFRAGPKKGDNLKAATELSDTITNATQKIISMCKMSEAQDAAFHVILGELLSEADDLKKPGEITSASQRLEKTLHVYMKYFNQSFHK